MIDRISRIDHEYHTELFVYFDQIPEFEKILSHKRLDILLPETGVSAAAKMSIPTDDVIIKNTVEIDDSGSVLSFFFRYVPQKVTLASNIPNALVIEIIPGNRFTGIFTDLGPDLGTLFFEQENQPYPANPLDLSAYSDNWPSFFASFTANRAAVSPRTRIAVYVPPYPWLQLVTGGVDGSPLPAEISRLVETIGDHDRFTALTMIQDEFKRSSQKKAAPYLAFLHAEILFRLGNETAAEKQLKLISRSYSSAQIGLTSRYISLLLTARRGAFHLARTGLAQLARNIPADHPLKPCLKLALLETGIALDQVESIEVLDLEPTYPAAGMERRFEIRKADVSRIDEKYEAALAQYSAVAETEFLQLPHAFYGYCSVLLRTQRYELGSRCFEKISAILTSEPDRACALYRAAAAYPVNESDNRVNALLEEILTSYEHHDCAERAALLKADRCIVQDPACMPGSLSVYERISNESTQREVRSEALFKKALVLHLTGRAQECVTVLMDHLRQFRSGDIRIHVQALLVELLPPVIERLIRSGNDAAAVTLARQNRQIFNNRWIAYATLYELAWSMERLGLYREAIALLLFLSREDDSADQQYIYLTLTRLAYLEGDPYLVEDFSVSFAHLFPGSRFTDDMLYLRIDTLYNAGLIERAAQLLPDPLPELMDFKLLGASIYFQIDRYDKTIEALVSIHKSRLEETHLLMLAESQYQSGMIGEAEINFLLLEDSSAFTDLATYRISQIRKLQSDPATSDYQVKKLVHSSPGSLWHEFAQLELRYNHILKTL